MVSSLLAELKAVRTELTELKLSIPRAISTELNNFNNKKKLVVSGLAEDTTKAKVSQMLSFGGVPPGSVFTLAPTGRPTPGRNRPLMVQLNSEAAMPHFKTLAQALKSSAVFSHCSVRRFESPEERHRLYLERLQRRAPQSQPINMSTPAKVNSPDPSPEMARGQPSQSTNSTIDSVDPYSSSNSDSDTLEPIDCPLHI